MSYNFVTYKKEGDPEFVSRIYDIAFLDDETKNENFVIQVLKECFKFHSIYSCLLTINALLECYDFDEETMYIIETMDIGISIIINDELWVKRLSKNLFTANILTYCNLYNEKEENNYNIFFPVFTLNDIDKEIFLPNYIKINLYYLKVNKSLFYKDINSQFLITKFANNSYSITQFYWDPIL